MVKKNIRKTILFPLVLSLFWIPNPEPRIPNPESRIPNGIECAFVIVKQNFFRNEPCQKSKRKAKDFTQNALSAKDMAKIGLTTLYSYLVLVYREACLLVPGCWLLFTRNRKVGHPLKAGQWGHSLFVILCFGSYLWAVKRCPELVEG